MRLAVVASHPIQYQAPIFRHLAQRLDLKVFYAHRASGQDQASAGYGVGFEWDVDLLSGYDHHFMTNVASVPGLTRFSGCDTPEVGRQLREGRFQAVLLTGWLFKSYLQGLLAAKRAGIAALVRGDSQLATPRSLPKRAAKALAYPPFLRLFDAALYVGRRSRDYWVHYGYPAARLFFSPHCVDTEWFASRATPAARIALRSRLGIKPDAKVALFAGRLLPFKRPLDLVAAAARLKQNGCEVTILVAGAGQLGEDVASAARTSGVALHSLGFRNQSEMPEVYAAADVLVLPSSFHETWGLVANEALACGRPVVLSDAVGSAPDLALDGTAGRLYPVGDVPALAAALAAMVGAPPEPSAIAAKSTMYSISAAVDGIIAAASVAAERKQRWA